MAPNANNKAFHPPSRNDFPEFPEELLPPAEHGVGYEEVEKLERLLDTETTVVSATHEMRELVRNGHNDKALEIARKIYSDGAGRLAEHSPVIWGALTEAIALGFKHKNNFGPNEHKPRESKPKSWKERCWNWYGLLALVACLSCGWWLAERHSLVTMYNRVTGSDVSTAGMIEDRLNGAWQRANTTIKHSPIYEGDKFRGYRLDAESSGPLIIRMTETSSGKVTLLQHGKFEYDNDGQIVPIHVPENRTYEEAGISISHVEYVQANEQGKRFHPIVSFHREFVGSITILGFRVDHAMCHPMILATTIDAESSKEEEAEWNKIEKTFVGDAKRHLVEDRRLSVAEAEINLLVHRIQESSDGTKLDDIAEAIKLLQAHDKKVKTFRQESAEKWSKVNTQERTRWMLHSTNWKKKKGIEDYYHRRTNFQKKRIVEINLMIGVLNKWITDGVEKKELLLVEPFEEPPKM